MQQRPIDTDVLIVGAGISGLSTAWFLKQRAPDLRVRVLEASPRAGGKIVTHRSDEFVCEGGPDAIISQYPAGVGLIKELGLGDEIIPANPDIRKVYVLQNDRLIPLAPGFRLTVPTGLRSLLRDRLLSWPGKMAMLRDLFAAPLAEGSDESLGEFVRRRFGQEALDRIAGPMMAGIYVADPELMSMRATFPQFLAMEENGSLIRGFARLASASKGPSKPMFVSLKGGMQSLIEALEPRLDDVRYNASVRSISRRNSTFQVLEHSGAVHKTGAVVLATPANVSAVILQRNWPYLSDLLRKIRFFSTATVSLAFRREDVGRELDGYGFIVPATERCQLLACTWTSSKFSNRSPDSHILLRVFIGGAANEHLVAQTDDELIALALFELRDRLQLRTHPEHTAISRWISANPQYDVGHLDRIDRIEESVSDTPGLHLTGCCYRGIGIPSCIQQADELVESMLPK